MTSQAAPQRTVLLVEDEDAVRSFVLRALQIAGFRVFEAQHPREAFQVLERVAGRVDLILTDVVMPGMSGGLMADRLSSRYPNLRFLFMSGNADVARIVNIGGRDGTVLCKPFTPSALIERVQQVLDREQPA
jgi:CheY-like chemotaxis protein